MKTLLKTVDTYRVGDEEEAMVLIEEFKNNQAVDGYTLTKSSYTLKTKKSKGEVVDSWANVVIERTFTE